MYIMGLTGKGSTARERHMDKAKPKLSRRKMLVAGGATAAVAAIAAAPVRRAIATKALELVGASRAAPSTVSLANASYEQWLAQVGSRFAIGGGGAMQLTGVRAFTSTGARPSNISRQRAFVAFFDSLGGQRLPGDLIYTVSHPQHGPLQMFLSASPDPRTPGRMLAVFN